MADIESKENDNSIDSVAHAGENLSIALLKFASKWDSNHRYISDIAVNVSIIANLLLDTKRTIDQYGADWQEDSALHIVRERINVNFEKVARALEKAEVKAGPGHFVGRWSNRFTLARNSGGSDLAEEAKSGGVLLREELESVSRAPYILERARDHLGYLYEGFRYLTLRKLQKEYTSLMLIGMSLTESQRPTPTHEAKELEKLNDQLPTFVAELEHRTKLILESAERSRELEARKTEIQENATAPVDDPQYRHDTNDAAMRRRRVDGDARSIASIDSDASYQFLGVDEVYEAWVIRKFEGEKNWFRRSWTLGWFTVYEHYNDSGYEIDSQALTIEEIKEQSEAVKTGELSGEHLALIERKLATFPFGVNSQIKYIVEDRTRATTNTRYTRKWKIVDIIEKPAESEPSTIWSMLFRGQPKFSEAVFIIKGETARPNDAAKPSRDEDPFRKPRYRRRRVYSRERIGDARPPREIIEVNRGRRGIPAQMVDNQVTEALNVLDPEEAESKIKGLLAETVGVHIEHEETLVSDEVMV